MGAMDSRDVSTRTNGTPTVSPKFSNPVTLFLLLFLQILPFIAEVAPKLSPWIHLWAVITD
jgi:hypothetical protein